MIKLLSIQASTNVHKKFDALFEIDGKLKKVSFGAKKSSGEAYSDFTQHKDVERKERYLQRHKKHENWNNPLSPGALSRWILWNKPSLKQSIQDFRTRFHV